MIIPAGVSKIRGGGFPARGSGVIVFETKAENGNSSSEGLAEDAPGGDRVERAGAVQHRVLEPQPAELDAQVHQCPDPGTRAVSISAALTTGPSTHSRM